MTTDEIRALEPNARRRLEQFRDCFKKSPVFDYLVSDSLGLMAAFERKSIEPIALWIGTAVRTLQLFLSQFAWDHARIESRLRRAIMDEYGSDGAIGVIDGSAHAKQGDKTPGVQRQWCGEAGKIDNCVVGQHLIYTNNNPKNPFGACVASDLYLPESWTDDPERCEEAHIPEDAVFRAKWEIAADQVEACVADGVRFAWITCDEEYTSVPEFIYRMDRGGWTTFAVSARRFANSRGNESTSRTPRAATACGKSRRPGFTWSPRTPKAGRVRLIGSIG